MAKLLSNRIFQSTITGTRVALFFLALIPLIGMALSYSDRSIANNTGNAHETQPIVRPRIFSDPVVFKRSDPEAKIIEPMEPVPVLELVEPKKNAAVSLLGPWKLPPSQSPLRVSLQQRSLIGSWTRFTLLLVSLWLVQNLPFSHGWVVISAF
ncbi:hypothetical protein J8273_0654 [Carpediemonas membranifera]|uniref:Uncharacterized protein n=1 Tax=Carpediemonas membranifera TaxID=201153 RepID=A0A8J6E4R5_9EUKA|nr:hypothetical protein J8273_0634 [Carpediemonas membranifera]KAG9397523.1 hypothetical protein J8273_0653 [Carpediemonas membranifera]KAG9397524.1 hypothetical protein J8273_0654 [Carpediemonas membranifera]|eukprot:KAG9397504.1 hypothetical protein J8273_0634 [Carpediemonas membranifera]